MKKVISGEELKNKMCEAVNLLCDTVKITLGPKGNNVIIDHSSFSPYITNDGVTIASNIESDDEVINTILELTKEASIKTNELAGDGTTTTLVLLQSIFNDGIKLINEGINSLILKKELNDSLNNVIDKLKSISRIPNDQELLNIATISSNDKEIGNIISDAYSKVRDKNAIIIKEHNFSNTKVNYVNGYMLDTSIASPYYLSLTNEINFDNPKILLINETLYDIESISEILNYCIENKDNLIIIAEDYSEEVINELVNLYMEKILNVCILKNPLYGKNRIKLLNDLSIISGSVVVNNKTHISINKIGSINGIKIDKDNTLISYNTTNNIKNYVKNIEDEVLHIDEIDKDFYTKRLSSLKNGMVEILVGANTTLECREKKMRYDDAKEAISVASDGIIPGSGITLLELGNNMKIHSNGDKILKNALSSPFKQILSNSGIEYNEVYNKIKDGNFKTLYNVSKEEFEDTNITQVIDPTNVVIYALTNACSIASMLLTTSSLVINEYKNNLNKVNDFNEL